MCMPFSEAVFTFRKDKVPTARAGEDAKGNKKKEKEKEKKMSDTRDIAQYSQNVTINPLVLI